MWWGGVCGVVCPLHLHWYVLVYSGGVGWCVCMVWYVCVYVIYILYIYYIYYLCCVYVVSSWSVEY